MDFRFFLFSLGGLLGVTADASGANIRDLAPFQLYAVPEIQSAPAVPLPPAPELSDSFYSVMPYDAIDAPDEYDIFWHQDSFAAWQQGKSMALPAAGTAPLWKRGPHRRSAWLPRPSDDPWTLGASNWRYSGEQGLNLTLGSNQLNVPSWSNSARIGGVSISQSMPTDANNAGDWHYSVAVGALDYTSAGQGDLVYGPTASNTVLRYGLSSRISLESQVETAPGLINTGLGGEYRTPGFGAIHAGFSRASTTEAAWKYQTGYNVDLIKNINLSWLQESHTAGYSDLGHYSRSGARLAGRRRQVAASVPLGRWGDVRGVYENTRTSAGDVKRSFGFTQQLWYSPNLLIGVKAEREVISGDYDIGLRLSVPIQ